jgi:hypothetical protein
LHAERIGLAGRKSDKKILSRTGAYVNYASIHVLRQRTFPANFFRASFALSRSASFRHLGEYERSRDWVERSLGAMPDNAEASYNGHLDFLKRGQYKLGYGAYFVAGRTLRVMDRPQTPFPNWDGIASLQDKIVLVCTENGYGDVFIALRFIARLKDRYGARRIIVRSHFDELKTFIEKVAGVDEVLLEKEVCTGADFSVSTSMLLYHACDDYADIPAQAYLKPDPDLLKVWQDRLNAKPGLKVGIRWAGNPKFQGNDFRKFDPKLLLHAVDQEGLNVISFQRDEDLIDLPPNVTDLSASLTTWEETAAALCSLDVMITSCTAVAHLSCALGVDTWVCVPTATFHTWAYSPDGVHSPWYDSARIYKQKNVYFWDDVFENIYQDLRLKTGLQKSQQKIESRPNTFEVTEPFYLPKGRRPLLAYELALFNKKFNAALQAHSLEQMLALYETYPGSLHLNSALSGHFLDQGDFQKGYRGFDLLERSLAPNIRLLPQSPIPEWNGVDDLEGKTIIVASGQGQGADLLVGRFIPGLRARGAKKIIGSVHLHMSDFFAHQNFYDEVLLEPDAVQVQADYWVRINSLIYLMNKDFSSLSGEAYVTASPARIRLWESHLRKYENGKMKVGLRFAGNPQFGGNQDRVFDPQLLIQAVDSPQVQLFSFQRDADIPNLPENVVDLSKDLKSWDDTAAALSQMDLVISSCTSVGHLAAAMGLPTWFCVPQEAYHCWRSPLAKDRKSYWYDSATVFRQSQPKQWQDVFTDIGVELKKVLAAKNYLQM